MVRFHSPLPIEHEPTRSRLSFCPQIPLRHGTLRIATSLRVPPLRGKIGQKPLSVSVFMKKRRTPSFFASPCHSTKSLFRFRTAHLERHIFIIAKSGQSVTTVKSGRSDPDRLLHFEDSGAADFKVSRGSETPSPGRGFRVCRRKDNAPSIRPEARFAARRG